MKPLIFHWLEKRGHNNFPMLIRSRPFASPPPSFLNISLCFQLVFEDFLLCPGGKYSERRFVSPFLFPRLVGPWAVILIHRSHILFSLYLLRMGLVRTLGNLSVRA